MWFQKFFNFKQLDFIHGLDEWFRIQQPEPDFNQRIVHHRAPNGVRRYDSERDNHKQSFLSIVTDIIKALFVCSGVSAH